MDTYIADKKTLEIDADAFFGGGSTEVPFTLYYGLSNKVQLFAGIDVYNQTFRFDGRKTSGIGDANIGITYEFQSSKKFTHIIQTLVKIPTASATNEVGTGYADYHFGIAQGFTAGKFAYDLSFDLGMLHRRDVPAVVQGSHIYTQGLVDSINTYYNYTFEPEIMLAFTPSIDFSDSFLAYTGVDFTRNTKLNYNSGDFYFGLGFILSKVTYLSFGLSKPFGKNTSGEFSTGLAYTIK